MQINLNKNTEMEVALQSVSEAISVWLRHCKSGENTGNLNLFCPSFFLNRPSFIKSVYFM
jgi:hypothetical protein